MKLFTIADINSRGFYASDDLRESLQTELMKLSEADRVFVAFAFTDYGGTFWGKIMSQYFEERYPTATLSELTGWNGQNTIVIGAIASDFAAACENYPLGFEDTEDYYFEKENEQTSKDFSSFIDDELAGHYDINKVEVLNWLMEEKSGYYPITTQGLDFCSSTLTDEIVKHFDLQEIEDDETFIHCDQCQAAMINGMLCHETGCPNSRKYWRSGQWVEKHHCPVCGFDTYDDEQCDCQDEQTELNF